MRRIRDGRQPATAVVAADDPTADLLRLGAGIVTLVLAALLAAGA